jgi:hypothetical protein
VKQVELLAPAGSPEALDAAIAEGADAVSLASRPAGKLISIKLLLKTSPQNSSSI